MFLSASRLQGRVNSQLPPPIAANDVLLLDFDGPNGSTTFVDSSPNPKTPSLVAGNAQINDNNYLGDGNGDYLRYGFDSALVIGTKDFSLEITFKIDAPSDSPLFENRANGTSSTIGFTLTAFSATVIRIFTTSALITANVPNYAGQWTTVKVIRQGGTTALYVNGLFYGTTTSLGNLSNNDLIIAGGRYTSTATITASMNGRMNYFRLNVVP